MNDEEIKNKITPYLLFIGLMSTVLTFLYLLEYLF
jgi:hypothetical protein